MTSLIAWVASDVRRPTGLYFASDSRRSWPDTQIFVDDCTKLFVANGTREIFGFAGDAVFPPTVLEKICTRLRSNPELVNGLDDPYSRSAWVYQQINTEFNALASKPEYGFNILHGTRQGVMAGARFHVFEYSYVKGDDAVQYGVVELQHGDSIAFRENNTGRSATVGTRGTGYSEVKKFIDKETAKQGNVSRAQFSAFCASVLNGGDEWSGGPIQLVGMLSIKDALHFGVVTPNGTFYRGSSVLPPNPAEIRWRNTEFHNVDFGGNPK